MEAKLLLFKDIDNATLWNGALLHLDDYYQRDQSGFISDVQPAIKDLQWNYFNINPTSYKSHVFVGDIIEGSENLVSVPHSIVNNLGISLSLKIVFSVLYINPFRGLGIYGVDKDFLNLCGTSISNSDLIVPLESQLSDLPLNSSFVSYTVNFHSKATGTPSIEMNSADSVAALLDDPISSSVWGSLPALKQTSANFMAKSVSPKIVSDTSYITIFTPHNLDTLYIDSVFNLTFSVSDTANLKKILIIYQDRLIEDTTIQTNYNYSLSVSNNYIDTQKVAVLAYYSLNDSIIISSKSVSVFIKPNSNPTEIKSKDNFVYLLNNEDYYPDVNIYFDKFISEIGTTGTALNINIANSDILSYNNVTKKITSIKGGETFAVIDYRGLKDTVYFKVNGNNIMGILGNGNNSGSSNVPTNYALFQNYPNPFNPTTVIKYSVPQLSKVTLKVYDILGREIKILVDEEKSAGNYQVQFNATKLSSGVYFYRMQAGGFVVTKKLVLLK
ncbi:MAG: T9SS type A sorting domain-containing protein [Ignavibacteriaceae bacterium]